MAQIVADGGQIDSRLQKRYRRAVPHAVRMEPLLAEIRSILGSTVETPGEDVADPEPGQWFATVIQKRHELLTVDPDSVLLAEGSQDRGGLRPQRTVALLPSFTEQSHLKGLGQLEVAGSQIGDLLHASSGIKHRGQERIVADPLRGAHDRSLSESTRSLPAPDSRWRVAAHV